MNKRVLSLILIVVLVGIVLGGCGVKQEKTQEQKITLTVLGAGSLTGPFKQINEAFQKKYPNVTVQDQYGGSVKVVKQVTELNQPADLMAVADYTVIPQFMFGSDGKKAYTDWYIGFVSNEMTFAYTDKSKGADKINDTNWFKVLAENGVQIGRSNPDTDPSGYQTLILLKLAEKYYQQPTLAEQVLANSPQINIRDSGSELISALKAGQLDYMATYKSSALQNGLKYIALPAEVNMSDPNYADIYKQITATTKNGDVTGKPIVYGLTIPDNAPNAEWARKYVAFILSPEGQAILKNSGFDLLPKPYANDIAKVPEELRSLVTVWPAK